MNAPMHQAASTPALAVLADQLALIAVQDLPQSRFELLRVFLQVAAQPGATQADISTACDLPRSTAHRLLRTLCAHAGQRRRGLDLLDAIRDPRHRHVHRFYLTPRGRALCERLTAADAAGPPPAS